jgi:hypothetical protein
VNAARTIVVALTTMALLSMTQVEAREPVRTFVAGTCNMPTTPFCDAGMAPIPNWKGHVFRLSQNYPRTVPPDKMPWLQFDPKTQPGQYLNAVLMYFYEGNLQATTELSFDPALNKVRGWYNASWQDVGLNGREFIHGLTRERVSRPGELHPQQTSMWNNYAVGFYNAAGAVTIGRVWANHGAPNPGLALMPEGTVAAKLLFTTATEAEVPYLAGAPQWAGYVFANPNDPAPTPASPRKVLPLRLLQIDIAVKDARVASTTGWVFGTFVYGGGPGGPAGSGWMNVAPVGLMWGNDPNYTGTGPLQETFLNPKVQMPHVGYQGRLNGPVDNKISSCLSCHSVAEVPSGTMVPPAGANPARWFRNIPAGTPFDAGRTSTDYSLQLAVGIANFQSQRAMAAAPTARDRMLILRKFDARSSVPPRDGGSID